MTSTRTPGLRVAEVEHELARLAAVRAEPVAMLEVLRSGTARQRDLNCPAEDCGVDCR